MNIPLISNDPPSDDNDTTVALQQQLLLLLGEARQVLPDDLFQQLPRKATSQVESQRVPGVPKNNGRYIWRFHQAILGDLNVIYILEPSSTTKKNK